ncbi:sulfotransferase family protein [Shimia abyssi]|uniref:Sulfotransferase family protein n=1 Tax=Shimia abyssi TaxID=1662395 RepID=A0A2P8FBG5_9RHOB|nr:sulfotransferase family protein [Shimia abyssi]PSL19073.1 hypothetical protein CLV88_10716 [Shimia abyssi]
MTLKVIGTGFGRTGTDSMRMALNILGVGPTHHMFELGEGTPLRPLWLDLVNGSEPDWDALFKGYSACVDWPSAHYWRDLINVYPEAKVLLTLRSAESWWTSFEATILKFIQSREDPNGMAQLLIADQVFDGRHDDRRHAIAVYEQNIADVMATVAPDRLLVHALGDGWHPLCELLDVPVPDVEYPSRNSTSELVSRMSENGVDLN